MRIIRKAWDVYMVRVSSAEFQKNFGRHQDEALKQPVIVTRNGRDRTVLISVEEYHRLKRRDRQVMELTDFTAEDIAAIERATPSRKSAQFNDELG
jgi:prevent-host-death family protein